MLATMPLPPIL